MKKTLILMLSVALIACSSKQPKLEDECIYNPSKTSFAFWSNVAEQMEIHLYDAADADSFKTVPLKKGKGDFWQTTVKGDLAGKFYTVRSFQNGEWAPEAPGIFAKAVSVNGQRAAIIDLNATNPEGWELDVRPEMTDPTDIVVYETHLRDFTMDPASDIEHQGKFLALTEKGKGVNGDRLAPSGIDHLLDMGITHLQILPMFDYGSIDEKLTANSQQPTAHLYNWGYDPVNYNVPEGGYSTNPYDPACRIREAKQMI
ncbi:MAG: type I pullulanase, partial [Paludibacteraceae bacterium]|nr:type I pullulanase [Paludibacteraceae bacterium]